MAKSATLVKRSSIQRKPALNSQEIERIAYQFFVERGCQHGFDQEDWLRAEAIVKARKS